jgi:hypothetical protein
MGVADRSRRAWYRVTAASFFFDFELGAKLLKVLLLFFMVSKQFS